jgi:hypothetical protein
MYLPQYIKEPDGQWTYNVTLRRFRKTILALEKQYLVRILSTFLYSFLSYPVGKPLLVCSALYCHMWLVWLYRIFPYYVINDTIVGKKVIEHKMCVILTTTFVWKTRYKMNIFVNVRWSSRRAAGNEAWIFSRYFWKTVKYHISRKSVQGEPSCVMRAEGRTGRQIRGSK